MYGNRFTRDFGDSAPEPWAFAISNLKDHEVQRGLRRLSNGGSGSSPALPQFLKACREVGDHDGPAPGEQILPRPQYDRFHSFGQHITFNYLRRAGGVSEASSRRIVAEKNRLIDAYRLIDTEEPVDAAELRDQLVAAFDRVREDMPESEFRAHDECFANTGHVASHGMAT